ncbi:MAG TPA: hypothetical protein VFO85_08710, partial [Vicinamibacteria bacterium]|nr:hypothetical protein [Vicinamibacteria bacterium]
MTLTAFASALFVALAFSTTLAAQTVLDFEDLPGGTVVTNQYGTKGVHFRGALLSRRTGAHSGDRVLYSADPTNEFDPGPLTVDFGSAQREVTLYAGADVRQTVTATLTAYDAAGAALVSDGPRAIAPGPLNTVLQVRTPRPLIRRVELLYTPNTFEIIDDLAFRGEAAPPVPTTAPVVRITAPIPGQGSTQPRFTVEGTVTGRQLVRDALIKLQVVRPPGSTTTSAYTHPVRLRGTGSTRSFTQTITLGLGPTRIVVEAENAAGLRGQAASAIEYLPQPIRDRVAAEGAASLGPFAFGGPPAPTSECTYAVYEQGAVALTGGQTRVVRGAILAKWRSLEDAGRFPRLGCPMSEERPSGLDGRAQEFREGRVHAHAAGTFFVPRVFASAIDTLGGEAATGVPTADPTSDSRGPFQTWLFQQFRRPRVELPSTLEIRGQPPRLFVQRQGGNDS